MSIRQNLRRERKTQEAYSSQKSQYRKLWIKLMLINRKFMMKFKLLRRKNMTKKKIITEN